MLSNMRLTILSYLRDDFRLSSLALIKMPFFSPDKAMLQVFQADLPHGSLPFDGGLQEGGFVQPRRLYIVGETGPELFVLGTRVRSCPVERCGRSW